MMELREENGKLVLVLPADCATAPSMIGYYANQLDYFHAHKQADAIREGLMQVVKKWHVDHRADVVKPKDE